MSLYRVVTKRCKKIEAGMEGQVLTTKKPWYSSGPKPFDKIVSISTSSFYPDRQEWIDIFARAEMESPITKQLFVNGPWGALICEKPNRGPINISFPHNCNSYSMRDGCGLKSRLTNFISEDFNRLCWADITYVGPNEYNGDCPANLDELCVFYKKLRQKSRVPLQEKEYVVSLFSKYLFEESQKIADLLKMPFKSLKLYERKSGGSIALTDCEGKIYYNKRYLFYDPDSIRAILVHELCHSLCSSGHGREFSSTMEGAMLKLGYIPRPCSSSQYLAMSKKGGADFPVGINCPGCTWLSHRIKGDDDNYLYGVKVKNNPPSASSRGVSAI